jgi:purine-binding chemotaxis protein CheW
MMAAAYCTFQVSGLLVGVDVERVQEVLDQPDVTPVPLADESVLGLLNLRGQIVTAIDARRRLGLSQRGPEDGSAHVIVRCQSEAVSLVVDGGGEVVDVDVQDADDVPETLGTAIRDLVTSIHQLDDGLLLVLDADRVLSLTAPDNWR